MEAANKRYARASTVEMLELCLKGSRGTESERIAADSVRSLLVLNLKYKTVVIPADMRVHYAILKSMT